MEGKRIAHDWLDHAEIDVLTVVASGERIKVLVENDQIGEHQIFQSVFARGALGHHRQRRAGDMVQRTGIKISSSR